MIKSAKRQKVNSINNRHPNVELSEKLKKVLNLKKQKVEKSKAMLTRMQNADTNKTLNNTKTALSNVY